MGLISRCNGITETIKISVRPSPSSLFFSSSSSKRKLFGIKEEDHHNHDDAIGKKRCVLIEYIPTFFLSSDETCTYDVSKWKRRRKERRRLNHVSVLINHNVLDVWSKCNHRYWNKQDRKKERNGKDIFLVFFSR